MSGQTKGYSGTDKFDGDLAYPVPEDYRTRRPDVRYGEAREVEYDSKTVGKRRKAIVVLPPEYSEDRKYPVVYLCHGLGQDQTQWLEEGDVPVIAGNMMADGWTQEMVLVLPNCRARERDEADPEDAFSLANYNAFNKFLEEFVDDLQPFIEENFAVAAGRENTAIAGFWEEGWRFILEWHCRELLDILVHSVRLQAYFRIHRWVSQRKDCSRKRALT